MGAYMGELELSRPGLCAPWVRARNVSGGVDGVVRLVGAGEDVGESAEGGKGVIWGRRDDGWW